MSGQPEVALPLIDESGRTAGTLYLSLPAGVKDDGPVPLLADLRRDPERDEAVEPVQILEGAEYLYRVELDGGAVSAVWPEGHMSPNASWSTGRLRPKLATGSMTITVFGPGGRAVGWAAVEVRSVKLDYRSEYQWMLRDVADEMTELVMERFAASERRFGESDGRDAASRYQQFAFLKHLIAGPAFELAMHQIMDSPHRVWQTEMVPRRPGQGLRASGSVVRQLTGPGPRVPWDAPGAVLRSLPARLMEPHTEESLDTPENRFVKFALTRWRDFALDVDQALATQKQSAPVQRGRREVAAVAGRLDELLSADLFAEVGMLESFPEGSQVLQKRSGYRDIFRAYVQFETAAALDWKAGAEVYGIGQRNVAALYEYWAYLQLVGTLERICGQQLDKGALVRETKDRLGFQLSRGEAPAVGGTLTRRGRRMQVKLFFNQEFRPKKNGEGASWTRRVKPDCSLLIKPEEGYLTEEVWLHFDAKYRVESVIDLFGKEPDAAGGEEAAEEELTAKRDDLYKMHTYRDAIMRTAGAYVLYPGTDTRTFEMYHELLPGLGAFALRPTLSGEGTGAGKLEEFIEAVLDHIASQMTEHERARYWAGQAVKPGQPEPRHIDAAPFLTRPPADTKVLIGFVRNPVHLDWIHTSRRYNLRADESRRGSIRVDSKELAAEFILLHGFFMKELELWRVSGPPELYTKERLVESGYQGPRGNLYFCLPLVPVDAGPWLQQIKRARISQMRPGYRTDEREGFGLPVPTTWLELFAERPE